MDSRILAGLGGERGQARRCQRPDLGRLGSGAALVWAQRWWAGGGDDGSHNPSHFDAPGHCHPHSDCDQVADAHSYLYTDASADRGADSYADADLNPHAYIDADGTADAHPDVDPSTDRDSYGDTHRTPRPPATLAPTPHGGDGQIAFDEATGIPPVQKLPSALVVFPYVVVQGTTDTRIELVNLSSRDIQLQCFYVHQSDCFEIGFFVRLTHDQPLVWLASDGANNPVTFSAVPPFDGVGELKCAVDPTGPDVNLFNVLQGRAIVYDRVDGETVGYGAIGFQRLSSGSFTGVIDLDGSEYEQCPERLHFQVMTTQGVSSSIVLVPCDEDLLFQRPTTTVVQLAIINEFEQVYSASFSSTCQTVRSLSSLGPLSQGVLGSNTAHVIARGVSSPVMGLVVERFDALGARQTTVNEPFLQGGRSATIVFP